jgi:hypothetical protein
MKQLDSPLSDRGRGGVSAVRWHHPSAGHALTGSRHALGLFPIVETRLQTDRSAIDAMAYLDEVLLRIAVRFEVGQVMSLASNQNQAAERAAPEGSCRDFGRESKSNLSALSQR